MNYKQTLSFAIFLILMFVSVQNVYSNTNFEINKEFETVEPSNDCDTIILRSGKKVVAKIYAITLTEIKYKKCEETNSPVKIILKSKISQVNYSSGKIKYYSKDAKPKPTYTTTNQDEMFTYGGYDLFAVFGFILCFIPLWGLFIGLPLAIIGLWRTINNKRLKGKVLALIGILIQLFYSKE